MTMRDYITIVESAIQSDAKIQAGKKALQLLKKQGLVPPGQEQFLNKFLNDPIDEAAMANILAPIDKFGQNLEKTMYNLFPLARKYDKQPIQDGEDFAQLVGDILVRQAMYVSLFAALLGRPSGGVKKEQIQKEYGYMQMDLAKAKAYANQSGDAEDQKVVQNLVDVAKGMLEKSQEMKAEYKNSLIDQTGASGVQIDDMVAKLISKSLDFEGGYTDNPADKGNYTKSGKLVGTNHGISAKLYELITGSEPTVEDMKTLSKADAVDMYGEYFVKPVAQKLQLGTDFPVEMMQLLIDINIKEGEGKAAQILGDALGVDVTRGLYSVAEPLKQSFNADPGGTYDKVAQAYHDALQGKATGDQAQFAQGWANRTQSWINSNPFS